MNYKQLEKGQKVCYARGSVTQVHDFRNKKKMQQAYEAYEDGLIVLTQEIKSTTNRKQPNGELDKAHEYCYYAIRV